MKTILYIDYNNTIEDIYLKKRGRKYFNAIARLAHLSDGDLSIYVITKANIKLEEDLFDFLYFSPENQHQYYKGLIKNGGETLTIIDHDEKGMRLGKTFYLGGKNKLDGVELSRKIIDKNNEANLYIFAGDDKDDDLPMINAMVKTKKYMILANNRKFIPKIANVIKTTKHSYGIATGIEKICDEIEQSRHNNQQDDLLPNDQQNEI